MCLEMGNWSLLLGRYVEAKNYLLQALAYFPRKTKAKEIADVYFNLGSVAINMGQPEDSIKYFIYTCKVDPSHEIDLPVNLLQQYFQNHYHAYKNLREYLSLPQRLAVCYEGAQPSELTKEFVVSQEKLAEAKKSASQPASVSQRQSDQRSSQALVEIKARSQDLKESNYPQKPHGPEKAPERVRKS
jgi:tetratricopeptide (TPR) repeat protein